MTKAEHLKNRPHRRIPLGFQFGVSLGYGEVLVVLMLQRFGHFKAEIQFRPTFFTIPQVCDGWFRDSSFRFYNWFL
ncbi:MAG: hypothetical protein JWN25_1639 [Verrucomicrobiales bacterium]|nr:hypothetical protein [Verrucomicrobiales bacterium]